MGTSKTWAAARGKNGGRTNKKKVTTIVKKGEKRKNLTGGQRINTSLGNSQKQQRRTKILDHDLLKGAPDDPPRGKSLFTGSIPSR